MGKTGESISDRNKSNRNGMELDNIRHLLEIAEITVKGEQLHPSEKKLTDEKQIESLKDEDIKSLLASLYPGKIPLDYAFYERLQLFVCNVGLRQASRKLGGCLWSIAYSTLSKQQHALFLQALLDSRNVGFWNAIKMMPIFCGRTEIEPEIVPLWFTKLHERVKNDLASGPFYNGIREYARNFPISAIKALKKYIHNLDDTNLSLAAIILGACRSQRHVETETKKIDSQLKLCQKTIYRICYYRSLGTSFDLNAITLSDLEKALSKMLKGEEKEVDESFNLLCSCAIGNRDNKKIIDFAVRWLKTNIKSAKSDLTKYNVVDCLCVLSSATSREKRYIKLNDVYNLLAAIQPIPSENSGTWQRVEDYLVDRLQEDPKDFEDIFERLGEVNAEGFLAQFKGDGFNYLKSELSKSDIKEIVTKWLLSKESGKRNIGLQIFQECKIDELSDKVLLEAEDSELELALLEVMRRPLLGETISKYLISLEPAFRNAKTDLRKVFEREMVLQAINYPGDCLSNWKQISKPSILLRGVIEVAEKYFENLKATSNSPAIDFSFSGYKEAVEKANREFSARVRQGAHEKSIFAKLAKNVEIIYGSRWSVMMKGKLGEDSGFTTFEQGMEFPRLEFIDPEGMAIKRLETVNKLKKR